jgi:broad specificity phosphatase PhoE
VTKILLTRHGHVEGIHPERFRGRAELSLTEGGRAEARALAKRIAATWKPAAIYTSPQGRCVVTGGYIGEACGVVPSTVDSFMDISYGAWQMRTHDDVKAASPEAYAQWRATPHLTRFPGGESLQDLSARTADVLRFVLDRHPSDTVILVGHDSVNRSLLLQLLGLPLSAYWRLIQSPCCLNEIDVEADEVKLQRLNDTAHLETGQLESAALKTNTPHP